MLDLWIDLPAWLRMLVALAVIGGGGAIVYAWLTGGFVISQYTFLPPLGMGLCGMGLVMLLVGGRSRAERNGYRF